MLSSFHLYIGESTWRDVAREPGLATATRTTAALTGGGATAGPGNDPKVLTPNEACQILLSFDKTAAKKCK